MTTPEKLQQNIHRNRSSRSKKAQSISQQINTRQHLYRQKILWGNTGAAAICATISSGYLASSDGSEIPFQLLLILTIFVTGAFFSFAETTAEDIGFIYKATAWVRRFQPDNSSPWIFPRNPDDLDGLANMSHKFVAVSSVFASCCLYAGGFLAMIWLWTKSF